MSRAPTVRQISWWGTIPQFVALLLLMEAGAAIAKSSHGILYGAAAYLVYSIGSRTLIPIAHRRGIRLSRNQHFEQAIAAFEESYEFFTRHPWIDRFRSLVLMSPSAISYREMALCNVAFCYTQIGNGRKATEVYRRTLAEFPDSGMAAAALRMLESVGHSEPIGQGTDPARD